MSSCTFGIQHIQTMKIHIDLKMEIVIFKNLKMTSQEAQFSVFGENLRALSGSSPTGMQSVRGLRLQARQVSYNNCRVVRK